MNKENVILNEMVSLAVRLNELGYNEEEMNFILQAYLDTQL